MKRTDADIRQNLVDAGCDGATVAGFMKCYRDGDLTRGKRLLAGHRRLLLDELHTEQRRIDCLDYLLYQLSKSE